MPENRRILQIRSLLIRLHDLVDPGTVLALCEADLDDLLLLAIIEDHLRVERPAGDRNGQGH
jgi:hypothetical protein